MTVSPSASPPPVTAATLKSTTVLVTPVAAMIASNAASIMPLPEPVASTFVPRSTSASTTWAVGWCWVPPWKSRETIE